MDTFYETIYRPPTEARSLLLEVSSGCSYGKCTFCRLSDGSVPLRLASPQMLCGNLAELAAAGEMGERMYLTGENVLAFKTQYLLDVFSLVRTYLPQIREFAMYARADDIEAKTDEQLAQLHAAGLDTLYVGVESGNAQVLADCKKGETPEQMIAQLHRLDQAGIQYGLSSILGLGGQALWREHATDTAALYRRVTPRSIRIMTLTVHPGTPLAANVRDGSFQPLEPRQVLEEEKLLIQELEGVTCRFVANHGSNLVPMVGNFPQDRQQFLEKLTAALEDGALFDRVHTIEKW